LLTIILSYACLVLASNFMNNITPELRGQQPARSPVTPGLLLGDFASRKAVPILLYHAVGDYDDSYGEMFITAETFMAHLDYLESSGFNTISFRQLWRHWELYEPLPDNPIIISFDDAYRSFYNVALPILLERGKTATVFAISNHVHVGLTRTMTPGMLVELHSLGFEIGSHSHNHLNLATASAREIALQMTESKIYLEQLIGVPVDVFAYPGGAHNQQVRLAARDAGYRMAAGTTAGLNTPATDYFQLYRITIDRSDEIEGFISKLNRFAR
jgi:peptidoglycan/xylan/chitin deacetylase (PgdA/CDA1 family)